MFFFKVTKTLYMLKIINKSTKINKLDFKKLNKILKDKDINIEDCEKMKSILLQDFKLVSFENVNEDYVTITFNKGYFYKYSDKLNVSKVHYSNSKTFVLGSFKYDADGYYVEIVPGYLIYNHTSYITDKYKHKTNVDTLKEQINNELVNLELQNQFSTTLSPTNIGINGSFVFPEKLFCPETKINSLKFKIMSPIREGVQSEMIVILF